MSKYGAYVKFTAKSGERQALADILLEAAAAAQTIADCEIYIINVSDDEPDAIWVTEVWSSAEAHQASLSQPETKESISRAMPLIAGVESIPVMPLGGKGL
ncbi:antibiotic biosynthesis monooxygenase [Paenibacillus sp. HJL G12]|uniref:Antibiotic biosynthesis monooxygenase n=1 Tax=Paenibacillus dendrobii TaxID=2691084 RepID=A0A7X3ILK4_9BACL|nr:antibiotic biosynthesis monooxygenase [Paenibacillus dendrobii]MWV44282.1 antibiotic biosynthesis monooxygenase [Paenibacillus dendrobii]